MDKNKLIAVLVHKLEESGVGRETAIAEVKSFVVSLSDADAEKLSALSENDAAMSKIALSLKKKLMASNAQATPPQQMQNGNAQQPPVQPNDSQVKENAPTVKSEQGQTVRQTPRTVRQPQSAANRSRPVPPNVKTANGQANRSENAERKPHAEQKPQAQPSQKKPQADGKKPVSRPDPNADYKKFYIILGCSSPIWVFLLLVVITLFLLVIGALAAAIVGIIAAIVVATAIGTTLCVVGIVYGITQLFNYAPIGLYEIGLGLQIGGYLMLAGIAAYNIAIRLLPYLIKKVLEFFVYTAHKCVELYFYVKGACADL